MDFSPILIITMPVLDIDTPDRPETPRLHIVLIIRMLRLKSNSMEFDNKMYHLLLIHTMMFYEQLLWLLD